MYSYSQHQEHEPHSYAYASQDFYYQPRENRYHHSSRINDYQYIYEENSNPSLIMNRKKHRRSRSFAKADQYDHYNQHINDKSDYYYHGPHRLDGVRSVSPFTEENRHYHHNSINRRMYTEVANNSRRVQPACFVNLNQPMINPMIANYCMPQSLGTCPTNTFVPNNDFFIIPQQQTVPMIQPYFMNQPTNNNTNSFLPSSYYQPVFPTFMPMPTLHPDIIPQQIATSITPAEEVISSPSSKQTSPVVETKEAVPDTTEVVPEQQVPPALPPKPLVMLHRKRSIMEEILSSFSLLSDGINYAPPATSNPQKSNNHDDVTKPKAATPVQPLYTSLSDALNYGNKNGSENKSSSLSRKTSLKLYKKANALQNRQYIWCYRPFEPKHTEVSNEEVASSKSLWAAFDMTNQTKLDYHYSFIMVKKKSQQDDDASHSKPEIENNLPDMITDDPSLILMLHQQSTIPNPVMISFGDGMAWYYTLQDNNNEPECHMLDITCLPTHDRRLVVSNDLLSQDGIKTLRRSKSMDGLASKLLNTVFGW